MDKFKKLSVKQQQTNYNKDKDMIKLNSTSGNVNYLWKLCKNIHLQSNQLTMTLYRKPP